MNLLAMRTEALNHGFDPIVFGARMNQYLNDAQGLVCRRVDYYVDEATSDFSTAAGTFLYPQPADFARDRSLRQTDVQVELGQVGLRMIDRSAPAMGAPRAYAIDGLNLHLYPTPDAVYPLELRYWKLPVQLVDDMDTPSIPETYHRMLIYWAIKEGYAAEDDPQTAQYWEQQFNTTLAEFAADVKFPSGDAPTQLADMWQGGQRLSSGGWSVLGSQWG